MLPKQKPFKVGPFTFSRARGLWRGRRPKLLRHQERQLLKCLLERPSEIVRKEEILAALWPDTHVTANTLNVLVHRLRLALGDAKKPHKLLKAFPRIGFMIVATPLPRRVAPVSTSKPARNIGDGSRFVRDVTIPDGSIFGPGEPFEKIWEIQNVGSVEWKGRSLRRVGASKGPGRLTSEPSTPIAATTPGQLCLVRMSFKAPTQPGSYYAEWKMVDETGKICFPHLEPLFISVDVVAHTD